MAWSFGDGFDLYASTADTINNYWDTGTTANFTVSNAGRFGGQRLQNTGAGTNGTLLAKSSGVNDSVHHIAVAFFAPSSLGATSPAGGFTLGDGAAAYQCSVGFNRDGSINLMSGLLNSGTTLATYPSAFLANTWYQFEFEIVIHNTTGSFKVRKNGNNVDDFSATGLNTRGGTANNYANKLYIVTGPAGNVFNVGFDDLFWKSDASSVPWLGDIRCQTQMPASDQTAVFARTPTGVLTQTVGAQLNTQTISGTAWFSAFTAAYSGSVINTAIAISALGTMANMKCAIFADNAGVPGTLLTSTPATLTPIVVGTNTFTFSPTVPIVKGLQYWVGFTGDGSSGVTLSTSVANALATTSVVAYATFPQTNPVTSGNQRIVNMSWTYNTTPANWQAVSEAQQDATTSYVYSSTVNAADLYGISALTSTPSSIVAVTTRGYMQKGDVGTRTAAAQLQSGSTTFATWDAATVSNVTLSGGNLVATNTFVGTDVNQGARVATSLAKTSGKIYFEIAFTTPAGSIYYDIGIGPPTQSFANMSLNGGVGGDIIYINGVIYTNGSSTGLSLGTRSNGDVIGMAVDLDNRKIWMRVAPSGNWNGQAIGSQNPVGAVGGVTIPAGTMVPFFGCSGANAGNVVTANFGASAFSGAVPSGFTSGWGAITTTTVASPTLTLTTSGWQWAWRTDLVDPNTSAAWTASAVNNMQIGPKVIA